MNWFLCWIGIHRWAKAPTFAGHVRRECRRCGICQVHAEWTGWTAEAPELHRLAEEGIRLKATPLTGDANADR